ncbi:MAG TPA: elongation factor P [Planctomycetes bacterium]|nr:elongation factor P [Planctomycetota bacterium]
MGVKATDLRKGQVIDKDGDLLLITDYDHRTPGNWRAIISIKTRSLKTGQAGSMRLSSGDTLEIAYLDKRKAEYLYREGNGDYVFMDSESYEQFHLPEDLVGAQMGFVCENTVVEVTFHDTTPIGIELPPSVVLTIKEAEMAVKGNTASSVKKDAVLETGRKIKVPMHIKAGEKVRVSTETGEFQGRAN